MEIALSNAVERLNRGGVNTVAPGWPLALLLVALMGAAAAVTRLTGLGRPWGVITASVRAVAQLSAVALVIGVVLRSLWLTAGFLTVMVTVAAGTSARRITGGLRPRSWWTGAAILIGLVPTLGAILASGGPNRTCRDSADRQG